MNAEVSITRVVNACVLLRVGDDAVLTDPYFAERWFIRLREPIGLSVAALPRLTMILGGHGAPDHWQPASLVGYTHKKDTPVIVATHAMQRRAVTAGFTRAEVLEWGATRRLSTRVEVEVVPAQTTAGRRVNNYVLHHPNLRVFIGTEARDLEPLRQYRAERPPVEIALLPIDASAALGRKLVMAPDDALEAARILGARILIPIHYALKPVPPLFRTPGSCAQLIRLAHEINDIKVIALQTGRQWTYQR